MPKALFTMCLVLLTTFVYPQTMRPIEELIKEPGRALVQKWIHSATNNVEVQPCDTMQTRDALSKAQVTTHSPMGKEISKDSRKAVPVEEKYHLQLDTRKQLGIK